MVEKTLVLMKPDAVVRGIVGEILHRFERAGIKMIGSKLIRIDENFGSKHYKHDDDWKLKVGSRNIEDCKKFGLDVLEAFGTEDPRKIGELIDKRNAEFLSKGPVFVLVLEGPQAVSKVRSLIGPTFPDIAPAGTIRGDFGTDSAFSGMKRKRTTYNMIHASGSLEEAMEEIKLWFKPEEILSYKRVHEEFYGY